VVNDKLSTLTIKISDKVGVNMGDIKAKIARLKQRNEVDILFIDYLQLIDTDGQDRNINREQEVSRISRGIKLAAKEFDIPIVVLCQLNRASEQSSDKKPKLHNLRESGSLEQDADGVIFIHRDWMSNIKTNENGDSTEGEADIIIAKWRDGETTEYKIGFNGPKMKFFELEETQTGSDKITNLRWDKPDTEIDSF
jgi:replicative DNA helicase